MVRDWWGLITDPAIIITKVNDGASVVPIYNIDIEISERWGLV